jgi:hypothetical protein
MTVTPKQFNGLIVALAVAGVLAFPLWPWCRWGYFPSILMITLIVFSYAIKYLART